MNQQPTSNKKPIMHAYQVRDGKEGNAFWNRIGAAWQNKDGGFSIQLDAIPIDGRIVCTPVSTEE